MEINPTYKSNRERFDWAILELKVIIEVHGQQHYKQSTFGGDPLKAEKRFKEQQERDKLKEQAAREAGWGYLAIPWYECTLTIDELTDRIIKASEAAQQTIEIPDKPKQKIQNKGFSKQKVKIQSRGFVKPLEGHKFQWKKKK